MPPTTIGNEDDLKVIELGVRVLSSMWRENSGTGYRRHNYICDEAMFAQIDSALLYKGDK